MPRNLEALAGIGHVGAVDLQDGKVLVSVVSDVNVTGCPGEIMIASGNAPTSTVLIRVTVLPWISAP